MDAYRVFITKSSREEGEGSAMEATQIQVLHKYVTCLNSFYDCCKGEELAPGATVRDRALLQKYFKKSTTTDSFGLESRFILAVITIVEVASSGPRFLSQAQRSAVDLIRSMIRNGSSEALLKAITLSGSWLFW
jgi:hypothetical protein